MPSFHFCVFVLVSLCVTVTALAITKQQCPGPHRNLQVFEDNCFYFHVNENATLEEAESACRSIGGGHLVMVKSMEISEFLQKHLTDTYNASSRIWIGLVYSYDPKDPTEPKLYQWVDNSQTKVDKELLESIDKYGDVIHNIAIDKGYVRKDLGKGKSYVCQYTVNKGTVPKPTPITVMKTSISPTTSLKPQVNKTLNDSTSHEKKTVSESSQQILRSSVVSSISLTGVMPITITKTVEVTKTETATVVEKETVTLTVTETVQASAESLVQPSPSLSLVATAMKSDSDTETSEFSISSTIAPSAAYTSLKSDMPSEKELQSTVTSTTLEIINPSSFDELASSSDGRESLTPPMTSSKMISLRPSAAENKTSSSITPDALSTIALTGSDKPSEETTVAASASQTSEYNLLSNTVILSESNPSQSASSATEKSTQEISDMTSAIEPTKIDESTVKVLPTASSEFDPTTSSSYMSKSKKGHIITTPPTSSGKYFSQLNTHNPTVISSDVSQVMSSLEVTPGIGQDSTLSPSLVITPISSLTVFTSSSLAPSSAYVSTGINPSTVQAIMTSATTTPIITTTTPPVTPRGPCPNIDENKEKMQQFRDKCFYFQVNERVQFEKANDFCQQNGGHLAMIKNSDIQSFIKQKLYDIVGADEASPLWIGIVKNSTDGEYYWMDGEPVQYSRFHSTFRRRQSVAMLSDTGNWMPLNSRFTFNFICEFDAFIPESTVIEIVPSSQLMSSEEEISSLPDIFPSSQSIINPTMASFFPEMSTVDMDSLSSIISPSSVFTTVMPSTAPTTTPIPIPFDPCYHFNDKCYYFHFEQQTSFQNADQFCQQHGGQLAQIKTQEIQSFIQYLLTEKLDIRRFSIFWIGLQLNSTKNGGVYQWMDGDQVNYNNFQSAAPYKDKVVILSTSGKWMDLYEKYTSFFICEYNLPAPKPTKPLVQSSWSDVALPSSIPSHISNTEILPYLSSTIIEGDTSSQQLISQENSPTPFISAASSSNMPSNGFTTTDLSARIAPSSPITTETLMTKQPTTSRTDTRTPTPCHRFGDKCFYFQLEKKITFDQADEFCQQYGGLLAQVKNSEIQSFLEQTLRETLAVKSFHIMWIGVRRRENDGQYYWENGEMATFKNFLSSTPRNNRVGMFSTNGKWRGLSERSKCNFICEFDAMTTTKVKIPTTRHMPLTDAMLTTGETSALTEQPTTTSKASTTTVISAESCHRLGDVCFKFELKKRVSFQNANGFCQQTGGSLALIKNKETQSFIKDIMVKTEIVKSFKLMWIGLQLDSTKDDGLYYWIDGETASYNNFEFKPSSSEKNAVAMISTNGRWIGANQGFTCYFICQFDLSITVPVTTPTPTTNLPTIRDRCPFKQNGKDLGAVPDDDKYVQVFENYKCLYFNMDVHVTFQEAKTECQKYGGSLVMIKSEALQDFIEIQFNETLKLNYYYRVWIGLYKDPAKQDGKYYWLDQTPLNYDHFKFSPTSSNGENVVLILGGGYWLETTIHFSKNGFVCEYDLPASQT